MSALRDAIRAIFSLFLLSFSAFAAEPASPLYYTPAIGEVISPQQRADNARFLAKLSPLIGNVSLTNANVSLEIPPDFYYLDAKDARAVLEEAWGNPADEDVLGMIFPADYSPLDQDAWGAILYFLDDGYIIDQGAHRIDYAALMEEMKAAQRADNEWRKKNDYPDIDILGWADQPRYDAARNYLIWAQEMRFGADEFATLNYDIRMLGRRGALMISFIARMDQITDIKFAAPAVLNMARFNPGARYGDFRAEVDAIAPYGIEGLILPAETGAPKTADSRFLPAVKKFATPIIAGVLAALLGGFVTMRHLLQVQSLRHALESASVAPDSEPSQDNDPVEKKPTEPIPHLLRDDDDDDY